MIDAITKVVRTSRQMHNEIAREPTPEELAEKLGINILPAVRLTISDLLRSGGGQAA